MNSGEIALERYKLGPILGEAGQSRVYDASDLQTGEHVALKVIRRSAGPISAGLAELSALLAVNHPNVVRCLDFHYLEDGSTVIIYEYVEGGSLRQYMKEGEAFEPVIWRECAHQILSGLANLHQKKLVHCDLKPENILVETTTDGTPSIFKIADLGISRFCIENDRSRRYGTGSPGYMAPEAFNGQSSPAVDLYSAGIILYEIAAGERPFSGNVQALAKAHANTPPDLSKITDQEISFFISSLLQKDPRKRPISAGDALHSLPRKKQSSISINIESETRLPHRQKDKDSLETTPLPVKQIEDYEFTGEFLLNSLATQYELLEISGHPVIAAIHNNHIELFNGLNGKPLNRFIPKVADQFHILNKESIITSDAFCLYKWSKEFRTGEPLTALGQSARNAVLSPDGDFVLWEEGSKVFQKSLTGSDTLRAISCAKAGFSARFLFHKKQKGFILIPGTLHPRATWYNNETDVIGEYELKSPVLQAAHIHIPAVLSYSTLKDCSHALELIFFGEPGETTIVPIKEMPRFHNFCFEGFIYGDPGGSVFLVSPEGSKHHLGETGDQDSVLLFSPSRNFFYTVSVTGNQRKFQLYQIL